MAGLLGVGGGVIIVPALMFAFTVQGFADGDVVRMALGTSMASIVFASLSSMRAHNARGAVDWTVVRRIAPGIVVGTFTGAQLAAHLPALALKVLFVVLLAYIGMQMAPDCRPPPLRALPGAAGMTVAGLLIGALPSLVGIGVDRLRVRARAVPVRRRREDGSGSGLTGILRLNLPIRRR